MKKYRDLFLLKIAVASLVFVCVLFVAPLRLPSLSNFTKIAKVYAHEVATRLSMNVKISADFVRNYSFLLSHLVETDLIPIENKRKFALEEIKLRYINENALNNLWIVFEPNAFDGMDEHYVNSELGSEKGVFNPWLVDDNLFFIPAEIDYAAEYYIIPKATKQEVITEPYWDDVGGKSILMVSISVPILLNGEFIGVAGTDFYIEHLKELISGKTVGSGKLVTDKGIIVLHDNIELIGSASIFDHNKVMNALYEKGEFANFYSDAYRVYAPVWLGEASKPWIYVVEIPAKEVYAKVRITIGVAAIILVLLLLSAYFYFKMIKNYRELQKLHDVKDKLFSVVAHELRSPLASLASLLKLTSADTIETDMLNSISKQVDEVFGLLDNLLRWAKSQMHGIVTSPVYFDVQDETRAVTDNLREVAADKMVTLNNHIEKQKIYCDRDMFSIVVRNLTNNAIKYTPAGGKITLNSELSDNMLVISVKDNGIGMPLEIQGNIFKHWETRSRQGTNNETGTGLGLVLSANFVTANGGRIWFDSKQGSGSTFFFTVPVKDGQ